MLKKTILILIILQSVLCFSEKITLAAVNWEPFTAEHLPYGGIMGEIAHTAFANTQYDLEIVFVPWNRGMELAKSGQFDGLIGIYYTEERENFFDFSNQICSADICFFALSDNEKITFDKYSNLNDLDQFTIGIINGFSYGDKFDNKPFSNLEISNNMKINVLKFIDQRIDLLVESRENFYYFMQLNHPDEAEKIIELKPILISNPAFLAISRKNPNHQKIIAEFNRELQKMIENGKYQAILNKTNEYITNPGKYVE